MSESSVDEAPRAELGRASWPRERAVGLCGRGDHRRVRDGLRGARDGVLDLYARAATGTLLVVGGVSFVLQRGLKLKAASGRADARTLSLSAALGVSLALFGVGALGTMSAVSPWAASRVARAAPTSTSC